MRWVVAVAVLASTFGCVESHEVTCEDGRVCPHGTACDDIHRLCVAPDQLTACAGLDEGEQCQLPSNKAGTCQDGVCVTNLCGDGVTSELEQCDGQDLGGVLDCRGAGFYDPGPISCTPHCEFDVSACSRHCGDGIKDPEEDCDDLDLGTTTSGGAVTCKTLGYYDEPGLGCTALCKFDVTSCTGYCGDGIKNGGELCEGAPPALSCIDLGFDRGSTTCSQLCSANTSDCNVLDWRREPYQDSDHFQAVFGSGPNDVNVIGWDFFTSDGTHGGPAWWHYDGASWAKRPMALSAPGGQTPGQNWQVWDATGWATGEIVVVADYWGTHVPVALHYDGTAWTTRTIPTTGVLTSVWGPGPNDVYATVKNATAPNYGELWHWDGTSWSNFSSFTNSLFAVWGTGGHLYVAGGMGRVQHFSNNTWDPQVTGLPAIRFLSIWGSGTSDVYVAGEGGTLVHYDGAWQTVTTGTANDLNSVWGTAANDVYAVGAVGTTLHYDGLSWQRMLNPSPAYLTDIWGSSPTTLFAAGTGTILSFHGDGWQVPVVLPGTTEPLFSMWAFAPNDIIVGFDDPGIVKHFDGTTWSQLDNTSTPSWVMPYYRSVNELWGTSDSDIYAVSGDVQHWNGTSWSKVTLDGSPTSEADGVFGTSDSNVFIVGGSGDIQHWNGSAWTQEVSGTTRYLDGVWATGNDAYAVGDNGTILHRDSGGTWTPMASGTTNYLLSIQGTSTSDIYAVGAVGAIVHYDGVSWTKQPSGVGQQILRVWAMGPNDAFAVGEYGLMLHYDGSIWTPVRSTTPANLYGANNVGSTLYVAGTVSTVLSLHRATSW